MEICTNVLCEPNPGTRGYGVVLMHHNTKTGTDVNFANVRHSCRIGSWWLTSSLHRERLGLGEQFGAIGKSHCQRVRAAVVSRVGSPAILVEDHRQRVIRRHADVIEAEVFKRVNPVMHVRVRVAPFEFAAP